MSICPFCLFNFPLNFLPLVSVKNNNERRQSKNASETRPSKSCLETKTILQYHNATSPFLLWPSVFSKEMCYQNRELQDLDPAAISSTCLVSLQQPSGILLLEEGLLHASVPAEPPSKRSRGRREIPPDTNKWIHLARYCSDQALNTEDN